MKDITFRHQRVATAISGSVSFEKLKEHLIEDCLSRGYIPIHIKTGSYTSLDMPFTELDYATCMCGYAGKKQARIIYKKEKDGLLSDKNIKNKIEYENTYSL